MKYIWPRRKLLIKSLLGILSPVILFLLLNALFPLDLTRYQTLSTEIWDDQNQPLRIYLSNDGYLRLPVSPDAVDPNYIKMLIAYEDKRFYSHFGVDPLALARAIKQAVTSGQIVSGASTLTMQVARLLEPRNRTIGAKAIEMFRALQLEQKYSKRDILSMYLTLAPFGGNREGVRAASLTYFNRPPRELTAGEAALLVALPQSPSANRPDRHPERARIARDKILIRVRKSGAFAPDVIDIALKEDIQAGNFPLPYTAPLLSNRLKNTSPLQVHKTWINTPLQKWAERQLKAYVKPLPPGTSAALLIVENKTRRVLSYVGAADYRNEVSQGYVDMVRAIRSPGSTLKPLIYGMALDQKIAHPESRMSDIPTAFGDYQPQNFRDEHYGDISLKTALQLSLNVPAVVALERVGVNRFVEKMRRYGLELILPNTSFAPGLAVALGGVGTKLDSLVMAYSALASDGILRPLQIHHIPPSLKPTLKENQPPILKRETLQQLADILRGVRAPAGLLEDAFKPKRRDISYKTGTSYGFRDAWAIGYNQNYTVGVLIGRPDGAPNPGLFGASTAAPFLFQAFDRLPESNAAQIHSLLSPPDQSFANLPPSLQRLDRLINKTKWVNDIPPPHITFPLNGSLLEMPQNNQKITLEAEGGKRPYIWVINGYPIQSSRWSKTLQWQPDGVGFAEITLIDALGRRVTSDIKIQ